MPASMLEGAWRVMGMPWVTDFSKPARSGMIVSNARDAEMLPQLGKVAALVRPGPLETRHKIAEQGQVRVVPGTDVVHGGRDLNDALGTPIGGLQGDHHEIRGAERPQSLPGKAAAGSRRRCNRSGLQLRGALPQATNAGRIAPRPSCRKGRRSPTGDSRAVNRRGCRRVGRIRFPGWMSVRGSKSAATPGMGSQAGGSRLFVMFPWVSVSITSSFLPRSWHTPAKSQTVWVLPTPPLRLMTVMAVARRWEAAFTPR